MFDYNKFHNGANLSGTERLPPNVAGKKPCALDWHSCVADHDTPHNFDVNHEDYLYDSDNASACDDSDEEMERDVHDDLEPEEEIVDDDVHYAFTEKERSIAQCLHEFFQTAFLESNGAPYSRRLFVPAFLACLASVKSTNSLQLAMGKQVSPILAGLLYGCAVSNLLSILLFRHETTLEESVKYVEERMAPHGFLAVHCIVDLFAQCKSLRVVEESRALWSPCEVEKHNVCGVISGIHLSTADIGWTVRNIQADIVETMFGRDGIFGRSVLSPGFLQSVSEVVDAMEETGSGYAFYADHRNSDVVNMSWKIVEDAMCAIEVVGNTECTRERLKAVHGYVSEISIQLATLLHLAGGMCGRATELASCRLENSSKGQLRSLFLFNSQVTFVPRYTKMSWSFGTSHSQMASRHMDEVTSLLYKLFCLLCLPIRKVLRSAIHLVFQKTECS